MRLSDIAQTGLVPSNYLTLLSDDDEAPAAAPVAARSPTPPPAAPAASKGATATALYDYEAGEDNELSFPENATIHNVVSEFIPASTVRQKQRLMKTNIRLSRTKTGGMGSTTANKDCFPRTTRNWMPEMLSM